MAGTDALVRTAWDAAARADWRAVYNSLTRAQDLAPLELDELILLGDSAWWAGSTKVVLTTGEAVFGQLVRAGAVERAGRKATELALLWINRGDLAIASAWLNRAQRTLAEVPDSAASGYLRYLQGWSAMMLGNNEYAAAEAAAVHELGVRFDEPGLVSIGLLLGGMCDINSCSVATGFAKLDEAMLPVVADTLAPMWASEVYCAVLHACYQLADIGRMRAWTDSLERWVSGATDVVMMDGVCRIHRSQLLGPGAVLREVATELDGVCSDFVERNVWVAGVGFVALGDARRLCGEHAAAAAAYQRARELCADPMPGEALLLHVSGKPAAAATALRGALTATSGCARARLLHAAALVDVARGELTSAENYCAELESVATQYATPGFGAWAKHARGALHAVHGDIASALRELTTAARVYRAQHVRYELAQVHEWAARVHRDSGTDDVAAAEIAAALAIYRQLGAAPDVRRLTKKTVTPGGLTAREVEILARIAAGASNRDVAAAEFITEKTVGRHLANIYAKIGVSSRTAAAAWARDNAVV